jgi:RNA polymerase sigma factor (sigma-70 family)
MKPDDPKIKWIEEPKLGLAGKMYLPLFVQGLTTTARHLFSPKVTVSYPEARPKIDNPLIYRGVHRLNKDEAGRVTETHALIEAALQKVSPNYRAAVVLREVEDLSYEEISEVLEVSPDTVMRDWKLAKAWLSRQMRPSRPSR